MTVVVDVPRLVGAMLLVVYIGLHAQLANIGHKERGRDERESKYRTNTIFS